MRKTEHNTWLWLPVAALVLSVGCRGEGGDQAPPSLEAVDVLPSLEITTEGDQEEVAREPSLVGMLPGDFPSDLPLYLPASLIDFGTAEGWRYVSLLTPHGQSRVERELSALAREKGWATEGGGSILRKGAQRVRLRFQDGNPGTVYRYEYRL